MWWLFAFIFNVRGWPWTSFQLAVVYLGNEVEVKQKTMFSLKLDKYKFYILKSWKKGIQWKYIVFLYFQIIGSCK